jgi:hypothetical protein
MFFFFNFPLFHLQFLLDFGINSYGILWSHLYTNRVDRAGSCSSLLFAEFYGDRWSFDSQRSALLFVSFFLNSTLMSHSIIEGHEIFHFFDMIIEDQ